jgi:RNA polymerase sigma-70 factor (ECF subfamily)
MSVEIKQPELSLTLLKAGDRAEFARLVEIYSGPIYRMALKMLNDTQDAEDVLQNTFMNAYRHLRDFEGRSSLSTWLYRIAVNESLMLIRRRNPNQISVDEDIQTEDGELEPRQIIDWCCLPEHEFLTAETRRKLDDAIQSLSPALRTVFLLRDVEGFSIKDTAEVLNVNENVVKTRLLRARLHLRERLTDYFHDRIAENGS